MKKHYHAIRVTAIPVYRMNEWLVLFPSDNHVLTIEDFSKFNESFNYQFVQSFYIGFTCIDGAKSKLDALGVKYSEFKK